MWCVRLSDDQREALSVLIKAQGESYDRDLKEALSADTDGSLHYQLARSYQATGQTQQAQLALRDYEEFRKAAPAGPEAYGQGVPITPP